jgi:hypothetical protein
MINAVVFCQCDGRECVGPRFATALVPKLEWVTTRDAQQQRVAYAKNEVKLRCRVSSGLMNVTRRMLFCREVLKLRVALGEAGMQLYRIMAGLVCWQSAPLTKLALASLRHYA